VNDSIAELYRKEYHKEVSVIRNIPVTMSSFPKKSREELGLPADKKILLFQGAGINVDRGGEEALQAMQYLDNCLLLFIGSGDVIDALKATTIKLSLQDKVRFIHRLPLGQLRSHTAVADIGLTLDKDTNINYRYSLPNKIFDYIHAGLPVLSSNLIELRKIVDQYQIGMITESHDPIKIAEKIREMLSDEKLFESWKENLKIAARELCWEKEEQKLLALFDGI
jgi:glycosyltransferase involved in cell wall biosynthesis